MKKTETKSIVLLAHHLKSLRLPTILAECEKVAARCATEYIDKKENVLILDELGYVPASKIGSELLFDVISSAYECQSLIVTTNLPFENWTEVLSSERLTGATLDRLTHRCPPKREHCSKPPARATDFVMRSDENRRLTQAGPAQSRSHEQAPRSELPATLQRVIPSGRALHFSPAKRHGFSPPFTGRSEQRDVNHVALAASG